MNWLCINSYFTWNWIFDFNLYECFDNRICLNVKNCFKQQVKTTACILKLTIFFCLFDIINNSIRLTEKLMWWYNFYMSLLKHDVSAEMNSNPLSMSVIEFMNNFGVRIKDFNFLKYINKFVWFFHDENRILVYKTIWFHEKRRKKFINHWSFIYMPQAKPKINWWKLCNRFCFIIRNNYQTNSFSNIKKCQNTRKTMKYFKLDWTWITFFCENNWLWKMFSLF